VAIRKVLRGSTNSVVQYYGDFWKLVSTADRKTIIHAALREGGLLWMVRYIPMRFGSYAHRLGYRVSHAWKAFKRRMLRSGAAVPYVGVTPPGGGETIVKKGNRIFRGKHRNFEKMSVAIERGANVKVRGTSQGGDIHIAIPYGHPVQQLHSDALKRLPPNETKAVVDEVAKQMASFVKIAQPVPGSRKGKLAIRGAASSIKSRAIGLADGPRK